MKNLKEMNLIELGPQELRSFQGGDYTITYKDDKGYTWTYNYDNNDNLTVVCVSHSMIIL